MIDVMNDAGPTDEQANTPPDRPEPTRSIVPFIVAATLAALVLGGVLIAGWVAPAEKNVTESDRITGAVREFAEASSRYGLEPPEPAVCPGFDPARSPLAGRLEPGENGSDVEITTFGEFEVHQDTATMVVTSKVDGTAATATWHLANTADGWLVCNQPQP